MDDPAERPGEEAPAGPEGVPWDYRIEEIDELLRCPCPQCAGAGFEPLEP
ncbi:MAG: hypothetical protein ACK44W_06235 [Planctomycetota bacterium]